MERRATTQIAGEGRHMSVCEGQKRFCGGTMWARAWDLYVAGSQPKMVKNTSLLRTLSLVNMSIF